jgi:hypothetical protein
MIGSLFKTLALKTLTKTNLCAREVARVITARKAVLMPAEEENRH